MTLRASTSLAFALALLSAGTAYAQAGAATPAAPATTQPEWDTAAVQTTSAQREAQEHAAEESKPAAGHEGHFAFGSYGRVHAASNLRGHSGRSTNIVAFGSRTDISDYAELELRREDEVDGLKVTIDATVAFFGEFFHFDAKPQEDIAVRNLYADVDNVFVKGFGVWAGSRMVRGDDIYLLNVWLLDNLNLLGGGTRYRTERLELSLHGGLTRPDTAFYKQTVDAVPAYGTVPARVDLLERPRLVVAAKGTYFPLGKVESGLKLVGYGEGHNLPAGKREDESDQTQILPRDQGFVVGAQVGGWLQDPKAFLNVFVRLATGIAVYDPLSSPMQLATVTTSANAREWRVGFSQNLERGALGLQLGGYLRGQTGVVDDTYGKTRLLEGTIAARPYFWFGQHAGLSLDASYQAMARGTLDDRTGKQIKGGVTKLAAIPFISPYGRGTYTRPHINLIYQLSVRDSGAQALYADRDPRSRQSTEHYIAVGAEWWFNSTSY